jgi:hypothetical protein
MIRNQNDRGAQMADDDKIEISKTDARAGSTPHVTRYVLGISLAAIVVIFAVLLIFSQR